MIPAGEASIISTSTIVRGHENEKGTSVKHIRCSPEKQARDISQGVVTGRLKTNCKNQIGNGERKEHYYREVKTHLSHAVSG